MNECLRSPIVSVLGHVDHGKSSILDSIRGTAIIKTEAGLITQAIGASMIPLTVIKKKCGNLLDKIAMQFSIPGLLFIDTPGHAAFMSMRKRGGSLADLAILVIDINEGLKPQTIESIKILRSQKTPFLVALNKVDLVPGYRKTTSSILTDIQKQDKAVQEAIEKRLYDIVGAVYEEFQLEAERFDRCDFTKQLALVPCSAKENIGIAELLMVLIGLSQKYLQDSLKVSVDGPGKGTVMEVKESKGLGTCLNVILYDGTLNVNDTIVIGGLDQPIVTRVKSLATPKPLHEMRDKKSQYDNQQMVCAATGVRINAPEINAVLAGMPIVSCPGDVEACKQEVQKDIELEVVLDKEGIIIKADTAGSLEALAALLKENNIPIRKATIGNLTRKDYIDAESNYEKNPLHTVILGFNIKDDVQLKGNVKVIINDVIYRLIDDLENWQISQKKKEESKALDNLVRPCKLEVLQNCIFRASNPLIVGVEVMAGILRAGAPLTKDGKSLTFVKSMQKEKENVKVAEKKDQLAISLPGVMCGRHVNEGDILFVAIPEEDFRELKKLKQHLTGEEKAIMKELAEMHRKENPMWGV